MDVVAELLANDWKLSESRMEDAHSRRVVVGQHNTQNGHEKEQKRKQRDEHCVGELNREVPGVVVSKLLDNTQNEGRNEVTLLPCVDAPQCSLDAVHVSSQILVGVTSHFALRVTWVTIAHIA